MNKKRAILAEIPRLRRYALALADNREEADELVQDALERALRFLEKWREGDNPRKWLFTIMHNLFIDRKRAIARRSVEVQMEDAGQIADRNDHPANSTIDHIALQKALAQLSPEHREVVLLVGLEGFSYRETAELLDIRIGTLMSRLSRGRERLKELMSEEQNKRPSTHIRRVK